MVGIYKITNPKGKIYIGQSIDVFNRRDKYYIKMHNSLKGQPKIYNSIKKYGWEHHQFEIIEECSIDQLDEREIYWGLYYNTLDPKLGLNLKLGNGNPIISDETKQKISKAHKGRISPSLGKHWSEESKNRVKKTILQYDLEGNFVSEWVGVEEAKKSLNTKGITMALGNYSNTSGGYIWKPYTNNYPRKLSSEDVFRHNFKYCSNPRKRKPIVVTDLNNNIIYEFTSTYQASHELNKHPANINSALNKKKQTYVGYIWYYKEDFEKLKIK